MGTIPLKRIVDHLRRSVLAREADALSDRQLIEQFVSRRDEIAFKALVRRHGPMVLGVCRRVTGHTADAEDAFQATFLVLARRAASLARPECVGNWLYGVASRIARKTRSTQLRRRHHERNLSDVSEPAAVAAEPETEL